MICEPARMEDIERAAKAYREAVDHLADKVRELNDELNAVKRARLRGLRGAVQIAAAAKAALVQGVDAARGLFERPRTRVLHGIKVGVQKGKGSIEIEDPDAVVRRIEKLFADSPDRLSALISIRKTPNKVALAGLPTYQLERLGCTVVDTADQVVARPVDGDVEKVVDALLRDAERIEEGAE